MYIAIYKDDYGNKAIIEKVYIKQYQESREKDFAYRLICKASYENDFVYFVSVYDSKHAAIKKLSELSAGTFTEI